MLFLVLMTSVFCICYTYFQKSFELNVGMVFIAIGDIAPYVIKIVNLFSDC